MTDLKTLRQTLRDLASKATPGQWFNGYWSGQCHISHAHGIGNCKYQYKKVTPSPGNEYPGTFISSSENENMQLLRNVDPENAAYIAAANPENILRLLDAIEEAEKALEEKRLEGKIEGLEISINVQSMDERGEYLRKNREALSKLRGGR